MFDTLIPDARGFLHDLAANNTRDWFHAHKADYDAKLRDPAEALLDEMAPRLGVLTGVPYFDKTISRPPRRSVFQGQNALHHASAYDVVGAIGQPPISRLIFRD
jgi:uncharacterized protein (DUF2461 family)